LIDFVHAGGEVKQAEEKRPEYRDSYRFYYRAIVPSEGMPRELFVEFVLSDDDADCPCVLLVNAHPQK
jgi:hypothetical protein